MKNRLLQIVLALGAATLVQAQSTTSQEISGQVEDTTGSVVPNVTVTIQNADTGFTRTATSNQSGFYVVSNLPIGTYDISAQAPGLRNST